MKKIYLASLLACATAVGAQAQSLDYLTLRTADGAERSLPAEGLKLTFAGGKLEASFTGGTASFELAQLGTMFFSATPTGIHAPQAADRPAIVGGKLQTNAPAGSRVSVHAADGRQVGESGLAPGLYIVNVNGTTYKILAR